MHKYWRFCQARKNMSCLTVRQQKILCQLVQRYIQTAAPVSSLCLKKEKRFPYCSATLRIEMKKLTDKGFLQKEYYGAGRIPTDKGYRFFVDYLIGKKSCAGSFYEKKLRSLWRKIKREHRVEGRSLGELMVNLTRSFSLVKLDSENVFWKQGWHQILREPEFVDIAFVREFADFVEGCEKIIPFAITQEGVQVFIGGELNFIQPDFSVVGGRVGNSLFALLGPKRMDFKKNISFIHSLVDIYAHNKRQSKKSIFT